MHSRAHATCLVLASALAGASLVNCSNANLTCVTADCEPAKPVAADNKLTFSGTACTASPDSVGYPYKILFIVDVSGSTATSDPTNNRGPAVATVLQQYSTNPEVSFAILSFDTQPNILEPTFTRDLNVLLPVVPQLDLNLGSTNYLDTLAQAEQVIANDANSLTATERARTRYDIQWLSDGVPNPCVDTNQILVAEQQILNLQNSLALFSIKMSTVFLTGANGGDNCLNTPDQIMQPMATLGGGTYQQLTGPNLKFNIDFANILQPFSKQFFYAVNHSRMVHNNTLYPDSDRDGVSDPDEATNKTDPTKPDTNGSGCGDKVMADEQLNPSLCPATCQKALAVTGTTNPNNLLDSDADGVHDCAEQSIATDRGKADTDGDNLIDPLEIRFGTNPGDASTLTSDTDLDGTLDINEILSGTDPLTAEPNRDLAYVYAPLVPVSSTVTGETCYQYNVSNVQLVQTVATPTSAAGDNLICLYIEQLPQGDSSGNSEPTVSRACFTANYTVVDGHSLKVPENGQVQLGPTSFVPYICGSSLCANNASN